MKFVDAALQSAARFADAVSTRTQLTVKRNPVNCYPSAFILQTSQACNVPYGRRHCLAEKRRMRFSLGFIIGVGDRIS